MENFSESLREGLDLRDLHGARDRANGGATNEDGDATGEDAASSVDLDEKPKMLLKTPLERLPTIGGVLCACSLLKR